MDKFKTLAQIVFAFLVIGGLAYALIAGHIELYNAVMSGSFPKDRPIAGFVATLDASFIFVGVMIVSVVCIQNLGANIESVKRWLTLKSKKAVKRDNEPTTF